MRLEHESVEDLTREVLRIVGHYLDLTEYRVFFFGSRVSGTASPRSDIDVGIDGPRAVPSELMSKIREEIENLPVLYRIDVVDFQRASSDFRAVASEHIELLAR
jgi:hypothetical protein